MTSFYKIGHLILASFLLAACQFPELQKIAQSPVNIAKKTSNMLQNKSDNLFRSKPVVTQDLAGILSQPKISTVGGSDFASLIRDAVLIDPSILSATESLKAKRSSVLVTKSAKEFEVTGTVYGGLEDVTDKTSGVAIVLNAKRILFDGGEIDARLAADKFYADSAKYSLQAKMDSKAYELATMWVELEKYERLYDQIERRLLVLDPLIAQLEKVAKAGIGDVSRVAVAQRTVSLIRVTQTDVEEKLKQARLNFENSYGSLPKDITFNSKLISSSVPATISDNLALSAPALLAQHSAYQAAEANLQYVSLKDNFDVGFEARATRPFASSGYDSDESIGIVLRKTIFNGKRNDAEIEQAQFQVNSQLAEITSLFKAGKNTLANASQTITSMDKAIELSKANAQLTADEISYLRKQLIIGGSTLDNVLSAEARLYEAQSKEINFLAIRRKAELNILTTLGLLSDVLSLRVN